MKINELLNFLNNKYPVSIAEEWDNCGLIIGNKKQAATKVMIALDLTLEVFEEALFWGAELIVTHHPFLFKEDPKNGFKDQFAEFPYKQSIYNRLLNVGICVYSAHTSFDGANDGMSNALIKSLGLKPLKINGVIYGRGAKLNSTLADLKKLLRSSVSIVASNINDNKHIDKVAFFPGSGVPMELSKANSQGYDVLVTADVKWSTWILAQHEKMKIIQTSHQMEEIFVHEMARVIQNKFKKLEIKKFILDQII
ncbi:Nif3-like dinuclear metal center hexameric protein [Candidatus Mycoplasma mahonii]|uniref:Nif3-like dinuclear metal center hexameric protein n=1 Tax=Candidatus Mycoplasma mahonii TaxID=3004105 RepID=UPI0026F00F26|nr:Nif3-like dinuclear metal center hexameric protein [Candidatus Mycoplasma mahonii]WKX02216.1 Nif3-like dinuclear metal center hexameric protein [Candidatus Mycoplasma mahonii]